MLQSLEFIFQFYQRKNKNKNGCYPNHYNPMTPLYPLFAEMDVQIRCTAEVGPNNIARPHDQTILIDPTIWFAWIEPGVLCITF